MAEAGNRALSWGSKYRSAVVITVTGRMSERVGVGFERMGREAAAVRRSWVADLGLGFSCSEAEDAGEDEDEEDAEEDEEEEGAVSGEEENVRFGIRVLLRDDLWV